MRRLRRTRPGAGAILALALVALPATGGGCGGDEGEKVFTPVSFISEVNARGAAMNLGGVLTENEDGVDVYAVTFASTQPASPTGEEVEGEASDGGTLLVLADAELAAAEYRRCNATPALTCFRAANAVLRFERLQPADQARLVTAIGALETIPD